MPQIHSRQSPRSCDPFKSRLSKQVFLYTLVGAVATVADWTSFYVLNLLCRFDYKIAVSISFTLGSAVNYTLNRKITFNDRTNPLALQVGIFVLLGIASLFVSLFLMYVQVRLMDMLPMTARIVTTAIMLAVNFSLHRFITFNRKLYLALCGPKNTPSTRTNAGEN